MPAILGAIASGLFNNEDVAKWIALVWAVVQGGGDVKTKLQALDDQVKVIVAENRRPTADEWAAWGFRSDAAFNRIMAGT